MPTITLSDQFGLDVNAQPAATSALMKYFQQLPALHLDSLDLSKLGGLTLDQPAIRKVSTGVSFQDPVTLGGPVSLSVAAGAHGSFRIICDADDLPGEDPAMDVGTDTCYVAFGIEATASAGPTVTVGAGQFGASPSSTIEVESYSQFPLKGGVTLLQAVQQTVGNFSIPVHSGDLADLAAGQITRVAASGKLTLSGDVDLLATTNPLASASLPAPLPAACVSAGGSATVGVSFEVETAYEIVAWKLKSGAVRLGWYHSKSAEVTVSADVKEGISAGLGSTDLFSQVIGLVSASPQADLQELSDAGLTDDQAKAIQYAVKAATNRKLEVAVASSFSAGNEHAACFLYEIDLTALSGESRQAVDEALRGDLTGLHAANLPGVSCVRSIWKNVQSTGLELDVNLLGILNYRSVAKLTLAGSVLYEPATGSLVISDKATADRIRSTQVNFGADTKKLRHVLAESFLITAAYHGTKQMAGELSLRCSHTFFELEASTSHSDMSRKLRIGEALGLFSDGETTLPADLHDFGRSLFTVSADYDENLVSEMFLDVYGAPLTHEWYESVGRKAIQFIVQASDDDAVRLRPATDDVLWRQMKDVGQPGFARMFAGLAAPLVGAIEADYTAIQWWADAMQQTARQVSALRLWQARNPDATFEDAEFQNQREALAAYLSKVAANTHDEFGQPWGLLAMSLLVNSKPGARILITCPAFTRSKRRALAGATGSH